MSCEVYAGPAEFEGEALFVNGFEQPGSEVAMDLDREADDLLG